MSNCMPQSSTKEVRRSFCHTNARPNFLFHDSETWPRQIQSTTRNQTSAFGFRLCFPRDTKYTVIVARQGAVTALIRFRETNAHLFWTPCSIRANLAYVNTYNWISLRFLVDDALYEHT
ncbi:hypothetical protein Ae201684_018761 [Aphanomyces euteiches]|uniref:Uncharacterized protein n=1 Tax=Aphanomyces euteiches TaxID=100861 RepID=A0A6G0W6A5_9STRA|nr:hypothetical protein Ae201684_018761 [Aphanomyces euteiches]